MDINQKRKRHILVLLCRYYIPTEVTELGSHDQLTVEYERDTHAYNKLVSRDSKEQSMRSVRWDDLTTIESTGSQVDGMTTESRQDVTIGIAFARLCLI